MMKEKTREQQQQPHKEEDDKEQHAEVQDARQDDDNNKDNEISHRILDACNHKIRMKKDNVSLWSMNMPIL